MVKKFSIIDRIRDLRISVKLILSFGMVVVFLLFVIAYQVYSINKLSRLQQTTTTSFADSVKIREISKNLTNVYLVFSDLVINRSFYDYDKNIAEIREKQKADIEFLQQRIYSDEDMQKVADFSSSYDQITMLLESGYDILKSSGEGISSEIIIFDSGMDSQRVSADAYLNTIIEQYNNDAKAADRDFIDQKRMALIMALIITVVSLGLCAILIFFIYRYITGNIKRDVVFARKLADGDLTGRLDVSAKDEYFILTGSMKRWLPPWQRPVASRYP